MINRQNNVAGVGNLIWPFTDLFFTYGNVVPLLLEFIDNEKRLDSGVVTFNYSKAYK
jgi:hypothetical protein